MFVLTRPRLCLLHNFWGFVFVRGVGANAVYALLAAVEFRWSMVGTDISKEALEHANVSIRLFVTESKNAIK